VEATNKAFCQAPVAEEVHPCRWVGTNGGLPVAIRAEAVLVVCETEGVLLVEVVVVDSRRIN